VTLNKNEYQKSVWKNSDIVFEYHNLLLVFFSLWITCILA